MQRLFKELNGHATNCLEYGKNYLAFLLFASKKAGADLPSKVRYEGKTLETGKLLRLLENTASMNTAHEAALRMVVEQRCACQSACVEAAFDVGLLEGYAMKKRLHQ